MDNDWISVYHRLQFKNPSGTSRGILKTKDSWFLLNRRDHALKGIGEISIIDGLSRESDTDVRAYLEQDWHSSTSCKASNMSSVRFGLEILERSLEGTDPFALWNGPFISQGQAIKINGLIWMGEKQYMFDQIKKKLDQGYDCLKLKIGAIDFEEELSLLKYVRDHFSIDQVELRVDANGGFTQHQALHNLERLSEYGIHSIEQPIQANQREAMCELCRDSPIPIALDEELIGVFVGRKSKFELLNHIRPHYIILKPSLIGGFYEADEWIQVATELGISWWATSALESNIGLNAIAQWVSCKNNNLPQGLGTGQLYTNNIDAPLTISDGYLSYDQNKAWDWHHLSSI